MKKHLLELVKFFSLGHDVFVAAPGDLLFSEAVTSAGGNFYPISFLNRSKKFFLPTKTLEMRTFIKKTRINLLHLHGYKAGLFGRLAAKGINIPIILTLHNFLVYPGTVINSALFYYYLERFFSRVTTKYITVSQELKKDFIARSKVTSSKVEVVYNGICLNLYEETEAIPTFCQQEFPVIGTALRLTAQKGVEDLLEAAPLILNKYPNGRIFIAGEGPLKEKLLSKLSKMDLEKKVFFLGYYDNLAGFLASLDLFVLPSHTEGMGIVLLEALASRVPVVATSVGGIPEIIVSGKHGILVPPKNPPALAEGVIDILSDISRKNSFIKAGLSRVKEKFLLSDMLVKTAKIYNEAENVFD